MEEQIVITIGGISAAGLGAIAMKFLPALFEKKPSGSIPPKALAELDRRLTVQEIKMDYVHDECEKLDSKFAGVHSRLDQTNKTLDTLVGKVEEALKR
jgi:tetrahydromethanopterin S-methyltransferase subunit G